MGIQKCESCGTKFNYMDLQKSLWGGYNSHIICRNCGQKSVMKSKYRFIFSIVTFLPVIFAYKIRNIRLIVVIFAYIVYIGIISALYPIIFVHNLEKNNDLK